MPNTINKVVYNNNTLIDLTSDTAIESDVALGKTFHKADGSSAVGTGSGGGEPTLQDKSISITANGSQNVTADSGYDGLGTVAITTNVQPSLQSKTTTYTENGSYTVTADSGYDGLSSANITVNVPSVSGAYRKDTTYFYELLGTEIYNLPNCIPYYYFYNQTKLTNVVTVNCSYRNIGYYAFYQCYLLTDQSLSNILIPGLAYIGQYAFRACTSLTTVMFPSSCTSGIDSKAFYGCSNVTNVYCPWSKGTVSGAPWGMTNATIHYNS